MDTSFFFFCSDRTKQNWQPREESCRSFLRCAFLHCVRNIDAVWHFQSLGLEGADTMWPCVFLETWESAVTKQRYKHWTPAWFMSYSNVDEVQLWRSICHKYKTYLRKKCVHRMHLPARTHACVHLMGNTEYSVSIITEHPLSRSTGSFSLIFPVACCEMSSEHL